MAIPWWVPEGRLMRFPWLDASGGAVPVFTVGWRIMDSPDEWSNRFMGFKVGRKGYFQAGTVLLKAAVQELVERKGWGGQQIGLATALSSGATAANPHSPLFIAGNWIARQLGLAWVAGAFTKQAHRPLKSLGAGADRDAEVHGKYHCAAVEGIDQLLVLDDFVTRGATLGEMKRALDAQECGLELTGLALAKNERASWAESNCRVLDNTHIPAEWNVLWTEALARNS